MDEKDRLAKPKSVPGNVRPSESCPWPEDTLRDRHGTDPRREVSGRCASVRDMGVIETFSKRMNRALGRAEVYQFETIPPPLRIQIRNLWLQAFGYAYRSGPSRAKVANSFWRLVRDNLAHDRGVDTLFDGVDPWDDCCAFLLNAPTIDCLDIIEYVFGMGSHV